MSGGWDSLEAYTIAYSSENDVEFFASVVGDVTGVIGPRMRIKLTQDAAIKHFIVTKAVLVEGNTILTLFGGTDYELADSAISEAYVSMVAAPVGFPQEPYKWMVEYSDDTDAKIESGVRGKIYNIGGRSIRVPTGAWRITGLYAIDFNGKNQVDYDMWLDDHIDGTGEAYCWVDTGIWNLCNYKKFYQSQYSTSFITNDESKTLYFVCKSTYDPFIFYTLEFYWICLECAYL